MKALLTRLARPLALWLVRHPAGMAVLMAVYLVMPLDVVPEGLIGPLGYVDDFLAILLLLGLRELGKAANRPSNRRQPKGPVIDTTAEKTD